MICHKVQPISVPFTTVSDVLSENTSLILEKVCFMVFMACLHRNHSQTLKYVGVLFGFINFIIRAFTHWLEKSALI